MLIKKEKLIILLFLMGSYLMHGQTLISWSEVKDIRFGKEIIYKKRWGDSLLNGHYKIASTSGSYSKLHFIDGKVNGIRTEYDGLGYKLSETNFKNGTLDGSSIHFHQNGIVSEEAIYKNGAPEGIWRNYDEKGRLIKTEKYKAGKKEGKWVQEIRYPQNNTTRVETKHFNNDEPIGHWESRIKDGNLVWEIDYIAPKDYVKKEYYPNGQIERVENYKDNKLNGRYEKYSSNGIKVIAGSFANGFRSGEWKEFEDKKGRIKSEVTYKNNQKEGTSKFYNKAQRLSKTGNYINNSSFAPDQFHVIT